MASPDKGGRKGEIRRSLSEEDDSFVYVFDRRQGDAPEVKIKTGGLFTFPDFKARVQEALEIPVKEEFVIATTIREEIKDDASWDNIDNGDTLYILKKLDQELSAPAKERVNYLPHYDTIVKGGMYEYYASEGQNPLPYAFAELIDNALAATASNIGKREIEIRLHFDDTTKQNTIYIIDNGKGMTPRQLNNWAIYRLSKFNRRERRKHKGAGDDEEVSFVADDTAPRSLNSDISYFGVGGKQAIFFIGSATRMITKSVDSKDVHELTISQEEFEKKEMNHESIYSGYIRNRKPGDASHVTDEEKNLRGLIEEEKNKESFTAVVIEGVNQDHIPYLRLHLTEWTRQLAHIYHYYLHGPNGNVDDPAVRPSSPFKNIDITVRVCNGKTSRVIVLRDIHDDMQSLFVQNAAHSFDFKATVEGTGIVEGILRYHPFLYDRETYPPDTNDPRMDSESIDDHDYAFNDRPARGRRPIFECYWNGRLIPYTLIEDFDWCAPSKKSKVIPPECYNRVSGVLWTNDRFQVSTNKLTFLDLEMKLKDKNCSFSRVIGGHERRTTIEKEFTTWLRECHEQHDKQVRFSGFKGQIARPELPRNKQGPWSVYEQIQWDNKVFKKGTLIRISRTTPMMFGTLKRFLLYGEYKGDVFATGGDMEFIQEPRSLYDEVRVMPLSRLDRLAASSLVQRYLEEEEAKLPDRLVVSWPEGMEVTQNEKRPAGQTIGDIKVEILNKKGELMSKLPGTQSQTKKLLVELKIIWHSPHGDEEMVSHICQHGKTWPYWFRKMENIKNLGSHSIMIQAVLNESGATTFAGKTLPSQKIKFTVIEGVPDKFTVGVLDGPFRVGAPFTIPLEFQDEFNHPTKPTPDLKPVLSSSGLEISYAGSHIKGNTLMLTGIIAKGPVTSGAGKSYNLVVKVPGLAEDTGSLKIRLIPGPPSKLEVLPEEEDLAPIENGNQVRFNVAVLDMMGNITTETKLNVVCKFTGQSGLPTYHVDCSANGQGQLIGEPICLKTINDKTCITAKIELQGYKNVAVVERKIKILPSQRVADIEVFYSVDNEQVAIKNGSTISAVAGEQIQNITFSVTDEASRKREVDDKLVSLIKVNWTPRINKSILLQGRLSDIKVPMSTSDSKFCQILFLDGSHVEFTFTVKAVAGEPTQMKCKCVGKPQVRSGELLDSDIQVHLRDKFGNEITKFSSDPLSEFEVIGESINRESMVIKRGKGCALLVQSIGFTDGGIGRKELAFQWRDLKEYIKVDVLAGPPADVTFFGWDLEQIITVYNEDKLPQSLVVQLLDKGGNPCQEPDIRILVGKDTGIKFNPALTPLRTNSEGKAVFGDLTVTGKTGVYELQPKAFLSGKNVVAGKKLRISLQPDPNRPVRLDVDFSERNTYEAGDKLPDITARVVGEDDNVMTSVSAAHLTLKLWKVESRSQSNPPSKAMSINTDARAKNDTSGIFHFSNIQLPSQTGLHNVMIVYYDGKYDLFSSVMEINVTPSRSLKLCALENPGTPTVSNTRNAASRCLIRNLVIEIRDEYDNPCGDSVNGKLNVEIINSEGSSDDVPLFVGGNQKLEIPLSAGKATLQNLYIQENSPGRDGEEYQLTCRIMTQSYAKNKAVPPLNIPFLFYNDAKKQAQMAKLSKDRDELQAVLKTYTSLFHTSDQLIMELKISVTDASQEEQRVKAELRKLGILSSQLNSLQSVENLIRTRTKDKSDLQNTPRRRCGLTPAPSSPEVIGKVCHLANVADADIARVLSWHLSSDLDCIVTTTTRKAKEIHRETGGRQQVLPLDSIYKKNIPDWNKSLPHCRFMPNWRPAGNPVYARHLLEFTQPDKATECKIIFGQLLGDVIILDTVDDATNYRQEVVKYTYCPTILTRDGDRVRSNGKFGGLLNKASPLEKLRGAVFGEPLSSQFHTINTQLGLLEEFKAAIEKHQLAKQELEEQQLIKTAPDTISKKEECKEVEKKLAEIEKKLFGMSQSQGSPVRATTAALPAPRGRIRHIVTPESPAGASPSKRQCTTRSSPASLPDLAVNGNSTDLTPRRQSRRISSAAVSPRSLDPRKRSRLS